MDHSSIFDHALIERFRCRAYQQYVAGNDFLLARVAEDLGERLATVERQFEKAIDLHGHTGLAVDILRQSGKVGATERIETDKAYLREQNGQVRTRENIDLMPQNSDLIVSLLSLHMVNDVPGVLIQIRNALKPDGLFLGVMAGAGTLYELRESLLAAESEIYGGVSPRIFPFAEVRDVGSLLQRAGFALPVTDVENVTVRYDNIFALMRDLRAFGAQNALLNRSRRPVSKRFFMRAGEIYAERFSDLDGRIRATFSFIWMSGWAPHESQQKPAKRGSATVSLATILNDKS